MTDYANYIQKIIFGSPGTGKSYCIREIAQTQLGIKSNDDILPNSVKVVFMSLQFFIMKPTQQQNLIHSCNK